MPSKYSIIQYVPDPIADERINIGVVAFDEFRTLIKFLHRWKRVRAFAPEEIGFLKEFAEEMEVAAHARQQIPGLEQAEALTPERIAELSRRWMNTVQLTEPKASLADLESTLKDAQKRFLVSKTYGEREYRTKSNAAIIGRDSLKQALVNRLGREHADALLKGTHEVSGKRKPHTFDNVVMNGRTYAVMQGISFELPEARQLDMSSDALSWAISDVHDWDADLPIGVVALPPRANSATRIKTLYEQCLQIFHDLGADVLSEASVDQWAARAVERIALVDLEKS